jgi:uncharacterized protein with ParB-like and HNH nuclease domain
MINNSRISLRILNKFLNDIYTKLKNGIQSIHYQLFNSLSTVLKISNCKMCLCVHKDAEAFCLQKKGE